MEFIEAFEEIGSIVDNEGELVGCKAECRVLSYEAMVPIAVPEVLRP